MRESIIFGLTLAASAFCPGASARAADPPKATAPASEADPATPAPGHSVHGEAFDDGPRRRATLLPGMGHATFPVTSANAEAKAFINQGVAQLHSFYYFEAERSFRTAAKLDPGCAMAYWGLAMANVNNERRAKGFLKEAEARGKSVDRRERLYLDAMTAAYKEGADAKARRQGGIAGFEAIVQEFPDDLDARAWLAMLTWQAAGQDGIGSRQAVDDLLGRVLDSDPANPGAHHYRIHLWDHQKAERALKSAALFGPSAPGIAHAWHMPGHTYTELKRYADAAYQQEASARVDHAAMLRDGTMPFQIHNYAHNNQWLATSLGHVGRAREAIVVARNLVEQPRHPRHNGPNDGGSAQRSGRARWAESLAKFELWDALIAATESNALDWADLPQERRQRAYHLGLAYAAKGDIPKLEAQITAFKAAADKPAAAAVAKPADTATKVEAGATYLAELEGHKLLAQGDVAGAFERFAKATPMRPESLARAHLAARNFGFADSTAKDAVAKNPGQFAPLAARVEILVAAGKDAEARAAYRALEPLARQADADLPVLQRLAPIVARWKADGGWASIAAEPASDETTAGRVALEPLGPLGWSPSPAGPLVADDTDGRAFDLARHRGRNVVVLFYLGGGCAHCMEQLRAFGKEFEALKAAGTDVVALGTDDLATARALKANPDKIAFPMPLIPDPSHTFFKAHHAYDEFEDRPLHATILVDARGDIRFLDAGAEPFLDVAFIKAEAARVAKLAP